MANPDHPHGESVPVESGDINPPSDSMISGGNLDEVPLVDLDLSTIDFEDEAILDADRRITRGGTTKNARSSKDPQNDDRLPPRISSVPSTGTQRQLVLIGAGHAHLQIVKWWQQKPIPYVDLTLVSAFDRAAYSGMLPAALAGLYQPDEMFISLPKLCERCGVRLIVDRANSLDPEKREIEFAHQPTLGFDLASINIGSVPATEELWQSHRIMVSVKPLSTFLDRFRARFRELVEQWKLAPGPEMLQVVVVGGDAPAVELAFCLEQHRFELELPIDVRIVDGNSEILERYPRSTIRRVNRLFRKRGIERSLGSRVIGCDDSGPPSLILENGERIRADLVIWAAGAAPPMALSGFHLPKTPSGFLKIRPTLQSEADVPVFAVGDIAELQEHPVPKSGVYSERQAFVLNENLNRWFNKQRLIEYEHQDSSMSILACGDGTAVLSYMGFSFHSSWAWWLKSRIDRNWVARFREI